MIDKNLFPYDLAVVAILKNEGHYLKEWLDYHLLAGVDHFYLYDNDSIDDQAEVAKPYVEAGLVDYLFVHGEGMQHVAYNDAVKRFKFHCRYMAFIDADEFIFPKTGGGISEVVDEVLLHVPEAAGLAINWQIFGSNGHETADYSRGVLERFTRRAQENFGIFGVVKNLDVDPGGNAFVKNIANPRKIDFFNDPHKINWFAPFYAVNENKALVEAYFNRPVTVEKIAVNHYYIKSYEEFLVKIRKGWVNGGQNLYNAKIFKHFDRNEVFDDGILKYRTERAKSFSLPNNEERFKRVTQTLEKILLIYSTGEKFSLETALTCRELSNYFGLKVHEEASLAAILNSLDDLSSGEAHMFIRELPNLLRLPYSAVKYLREVTPRILQQSIDFQFKRLEMNWRYYVELDYLRDLFKE